MSRVLAVKPLRRPPNPSVASRSHPIRRSSCFVLRALCAACIASVVGLGASSAQAATFTPLSLQNGWTNAPFATHEAQVSKIGGIVHLQGAIATSGTNPVPFTLPAGFRPASNVYVKVDLCNATNGRLFIQPSGVVTVQAQGSFANAQCFTSLDGASFATSTTGFTALAPVNGWSNAPFGTSNAAVSNISGVVHFKGAIATSGTNAVAFTLPAGFRPTSNVYVPVDMCNATNGRLVISPSGVVSVQAGGSFSNAQCFTSLDGASFAQNATSFSPLTVVNGWTNAPFGTSNAAVRNISGVVHFEGAIATGGTNPVAFTLPSSFRPATNVYVPIDLCNATNGRLVISPSGVVSIQAESSFSNAQCFTSLDGASFAP